MGSTAYRFDLGNFKCLVVSDGTIKVPDPPSSQSCESPDRRRGEVIDVLCLFIDTGKHKILVDTGCGGGFQPTAGKLVRNLQAEGISCADIDTIIHTHGHGDHVSGSFDAEGKAVFPNARYKVSKKEWECWITRPEESQNQPMFAAVRKHYLRIPEKIDLVEDNTEIFSCIKLLPAPGHTPGNCMVEITSGTRQLLCVGDAIHTSLEFRYPEFYSFLDVAPEKAVQTRDQILSAAAKSCLTIFACHFPSPGLGRIVQKGEIFSWQPLKRFS